jgi:hypothetical protein
LLYDGTDKQLAIFHTSLAAKVSESNIEAERFVDYIQNASPKLLGNDGLLIQCSGNRASMARVKMLFQKGNNAFNYYELDKAEEYFNQAAAEILCLKDPIDIEVISQIYYFSGIVNEEKGDSEGAYKDFRRALTFTPNLSWNENYSPDLRVSFDRASKDFAGERDILVDVYPSSIRSNILINGQELSSDGQAIVNTGLNVVQVFGEFVHTYYMQVPERATQLELVVPQGLPEDALSWVENEQQSTELQLCFEGMFPPDSNMYVHHQGMVFEHSVGTDSWTELKINNVNRSLLWLRSERFARSLKYSGLGLTAVAGSVSAANVLLSYRYNRQAQMTDTFPIYDDNRTKYNNIADGHSLWVASTLVGLGLTGIGFTLEF